MAWPSIFMSTREVLSVCGDGPGGSNHGHGSNVPLHVWPRTNVMRALSMLGVGGSCGTDAGISQRSVTAKWHRSTPGNESRLVRLDAAVSTTLHRGGCGPSGGVPMMRGLITVGTSAQAGLSGVRLPK
jgi:hypothetical protein